MKTKLIFSVAIRSRLIYTLKVMDTRIKIKYIQNEISSQLNNKTEKNKIKI